MSTQVPASGGQQKNTGSPTVKPSPIKTVIFDYGCVLSAVPGPESFEPLRKALGATPEAFQPMYWRDREAFDLDTFDVNRYYQEMGQTMGVTFTPEQINRFGLLDSQMWGTSNPIMVDWVRLLRDQGYKTAVLSNMSRNVGDYLKREVKWLELFNHLCFSAELKLAKPDHAIYHSCLGGVGNAPAETLFLDDREVNIKAAKEVGIHGILFRTPQELVPELEPYGLADSLREVIARAR